MPENMQNTETVENHRCKRCGFDQREDYTPVNDDLLQEYFRYALAQKPFTKTYELYNGTIELVFEEATGKLLRLQEHTIMALGRGDTPPALSDVADFSLLTSLVSIRQRAVAGGPLTTIYFADAGRREQLLTEQKLPDELNAVPMILLQALRSAYTQFARLCGALITAAQDENFWQGVGRN